MGSPIRGAAPAGDGQAGRTVVARLGVGQGWPVAMDRHQSWVELCLGAFVVAHAGLLDGRPATTRWSVAPAFARMFPTVRLDPRVLYIDDGDVLTSAGSAAGSTAACT